MSMILVERDRIRSSIRALLGHCPAQRRRGAVRAREAGLGKSALLDHALDAAPVPPTSSSPGPRSTQSHACSNSAKRSRVCTPGAVRSSLVVHASGSHIRVSVGRTTIPGRRRQSAAPGRRARQAHSSLHAAGWSEIASGVVAQLRPKQNSVGLSPLLGDEAQTIAGTISGTMACPTSSLYAGVFLGLKAAWFGGKRLVSLRNAVIDRPLVRAPASKT